MPLSADGLHKSGITDREVSPTHTDQDSMTKQVPMNSRQVELINAAHKDLERSREKQQLNAILAGIAAGLEGKLVSADTDAKVFNVEVPEETTPAENT